MIKCFNYDDSLNNEQILRSELKKKNDIILYKTRELKILRDELIEKRMCCSIVENDFIMIKKEYNKILQDYNIMKKEHDILKEENNKIKNCLQNILNH